MKSNHQRADIKRKHHYVWAEYLKQWAADDNVWYITSKNEIRQDSIYGVSQKKDFYKVNPLDDQDVAFLKLFPIPNSPDVKHFHESQLQYFIMISAVINAPKVFGYLSGDGELEHIAKVAACNSLEDTHTAIELLARPVMNELWRGNSECLSDRSNMVAFCNYLAHQLARTRKLKEVFFAGMHEVNDGSKEWPDHARLLEKNWWMLSLKVGINLGYSLVRNITADNHVFIKNTTGIDFVTSDFPVINVHKSAQNYRFGAVVENMDLYYPLSPKLAYMINESADYNHLAGDIDEDAVKKFNILMSAKSQDNVYGVSEQSLKDVRKSYRVRTR